jgi:poly(A) polymerase
VLREAVMAICREHIRFASLPAMRPRRREQFLRRPDFARQLAFHRADCLGSHGKLDIHDAMSAEWQALPPVRPAYCSGADVLAMGVQPGPVVGQLLRDLDDVIDRMEAPDRERALVELQRLVGLRLKGG